MTRDEAIELVTSIDYWGARSLGASRETAKRIVDRLNDKGALILDEERPLPRRDGLPCACVGGPHGGYTCEGCR